MAGTVGHAPQVAEEASRVKKATQNANGYLESPGDTAGVFSDFSHAVRWMEIWLKKRCAIGGRSSEIYWSDV